MGIDEELRREVRALAMEVWREARAHVYWRVACMSRRGVRFLVRRAGVEGQEYLRVAGVDVEHLADGPV